MLCLFLLIITFSASKPAVVKWTPNKSFNLAINFRDQKLPCSKQNVVFPETIWEAVKIESDVSISSLVLPKSGEIVIEEAAINFGSVANENCTEDGNSYYTPRSQYSWAQPDVWSSSKFNEATPDAERIPCYDDEVVFPANAQFTVLLPRETQYIRKLNIAGTNYDTRWFLFNLLHNSNLELLSQQFILNEYSDTGLVIEDKGCTSNFRCPCQKNLLKIDCTVKFCPAPKCLSPIQPFGQCCKICGGYLTLNIGESFDMLAFEENVAEIIDSYGKENLIYHIGILAENKIQLVVVDKGEYVGTSAEAVNDIAYKVNNRGLQGVAAISGGPTSTAGLGGKIAISAFFLIILVMGAIYAYYYKPSELAEFRFPLMARGTRGVMTRFNRRTESVVSLTSRRDSTATIGSTAGTAFRNPLYDSKRGRVKVTEAVDEE